MGKNRIINILGCQYPVILGPMRRKTLGEMAATVSNSGGFGQIAASGLSAEQLRREIAKARNLTDRPIGVNIPIYRPNASEALEISIEAGIQIITTSAGNPAKLIKRIKEAGLKVLHKVSSEDMALKAEAYGVDGIIATGYEAGGHLGRNGTTTICLIPQLVDVVKIPIVAAGGIADARGLVAAFALGAEGVEMGTRFLATHECPVPYCYKQLVLDAKSDSTVVLAEKTMPIRVLKNRMREITRQQDKAQENKHLHRLDSGSTYKQSESDASTGSMPGGQIAGLIKEIKDIENVIPELVHGANRLSQRLAAEFGGL